VLAARAQARVALGRDPDSSDPYGAPPKRKTPTPASPPSAPGWMKSDPSTTQYVLSIGEAAGRLGVSRSTLEAMIDAGKVEALPTGLTRMIPTREIQRLTRGKNLI
jgi:excisionase family DNA binding protein